MVRFIRRFPVLSFFAMFLVLEWITFTLPLLSAWEVLPVVVPMEYMLPVLTLVCLAAPALLFTHVIEGPSAVRDMLRQVVRWRVGVGTYVFAVVAVPVVAGMLALSTAGPNAQAIPWFTVAGVLIVEVALGSLLVNLAEELGWMGYVQSRLEHRFGATRATLAIAPLFALGHLPLLLFPGQPPLLAGLGLMLVMAVPFRATLGWLYRRSGSSVLVVGLFHAAFNAAGSPRFLNQFSGPDRTGLEHIAALLLVSSMLVGGMHLRRRWERRLQSKVGRPASAEDR